MPSTEPPSVAVIGAGISGLSAAWLLSRRCKVTLYEAQGRLGGHAHTVEAEGTSVDTGFIVYNESNYPNLTALFAHLGVATERSDMSFGVSVDSGAFEYSSNNLWGFLGRGANLAQPRFWAMLKDLRRFYRHGAREVAQLADPLAALGDYLEAGGYCRAFQEDHLLPQAAAIWSTQVGSIREYPATAMVRFLQNHGLMRVKGRPKWRTVTGGSRAYVSTLLKAFDGEVVSSAPVVSIKRGPDGVVIRDGRGEARRFDEVVIAAHADEALAMLQDPTPQETRLLGAFRYSRNLAVLHSDESLMPRRRAMWSSWNHIGRRGDSASCVTYWMNRLQNLRTRRPLFVTINPIAPPAPETVHRSDVYEHPLFDAAALRAQQSLWSLQGVRRTWFCGAYFGSGFHEDGLQAGLAVAEALSGEKRPWSVAEESGRIWLTEPQSAEQAA